ncbi:putative protein C11orf97 [Galemys pyrenaicus]|uniref:Uncharacterized protein n=1 Tax=Galemys pyrenaicus TaxID=202257 RepID=A0A8J6DY49_GALPY|nr:putative protein C11orf97 [Galemys pyrenaicus]
MHGSGCRADRLDERAAVRQQGQHQRGTLAGSRHPGRAVWTASQCRPHSAASPQQTTHRPHRERRRAGPSRAPDGLDLPSPEPDGRGHFPDPDGSTLAGGTHPYSPVHLPAPPVGGLYWFRGDTSPRQAEVPAVCPDPGARGGARRTRLGAGRGKKFLYCEPHRRVREVQEEELSMKRDECHVRNAPAGSCGRACASTGDRCFASLLFLCQRGGLSPEAPVLRTQPREQRPQSRCGLHRVQPPPGAVLRSLRGFWTPSHTTTRHAGVTAVAESSLNGWRIRFYLCLDALTVALDGIWSFKRDLPAGGLKPAPSRNSLLPQAKYYSRHGGLRSKTPARAAPLSLASFQEARGAGTQVGGSATASLGYGFEAQTGGKNDPANGGVWRKGSSRGTCSCNSRCSASTRRWQ